MFSFHHRLIFLIFCFCANYFGLRAYNLEVQLRNHDQLPISNMSVLLYEKGVLIKEQKTSDQGVTTFKELSQKELMIRIIDSNGDYATEDWIVYNKKREDRIEIHTARYTSGRLKEVTDNILQDYLSNQDIEQCTSSDQNPEFPGGKELLTQYLASNVNYPQESIEYGDQGNVYIAFVVETDGSITNCRVLKGVTRALDQEALRLIKEMPNWIPGKCEGVVYRTYVSMPIVFRLM